MKPKLEIKYSSKSTCEHFHEQCLT